MPTTERFASVGPGPGTTRVRVGPIVALVVAGLLTILAVVLVILSLTAAPGPVTHRYVVPAGTASRIANGETVTILPAELDVRVGDRLVIRNDDDADFNVGPYTVRRGETLSQTFHRPGGITGECGLTPTNDIRIFIR